MAAYRYGSVVRLLDDDPNNGMSAGDIVGEAGKHADGDELYTTMGQNDIHKICAETIEVYDVTVNGESVGEKRAQRRALEKIREDDEYDLDEIREKGAPADD